jgi:hypothetical protein
MTSRYAGHAHLGLAISWAIALVSVGLATMAIRLLIGV